jgi:hypothetical protein
MLRTETNTPAMDKRIRRAARERFRTRLIQTDFEHGQWWVTLRNGSQWSVCDAEGYGSFSGFSFEQVTGGDE